jgi:hypothetical protein
MPQEIINIGVDDKRSHDKACFERRFVRFESVKQFHYNTLKQFRD